LTPFEQLMRRLYPPIGFSRCYVLGCRANAALGRLHKIYGPVDCCSGHDPETVGQARPFGVAKPVVEAPVVEDPAGESEMTREQVIVAMLTELVGMVKPGDPDGGKKAKLKKPKPTKPSSGVGLVPRPPRVVMTDEGPMYDLGPRGGAQ
jgi:hypothetical protein